MLFVGVPHIYDPKVHPLFGEKVAVCVVCWFSSYTIYDSKVHPVFREKVVCVVC